MGSMRCARTFGAVLLLIAAASALPAHAQEVSDQYPPDWSTDVHCPAEVDGDPLTEVRTIVFDGPSVTSTDVGDRSLDCRYGDDVTTGPRITLGWATHDNADEEQWCGIEDAEDNSRLYLYSRTHRVSSFSEYAQPARVEIERMIRGAETMALPCGGTTTTTLPDICAVEGVVTGPDGLPVGGLRVELRGPGEQLLSTAGTDAAGRYRFDPPDGSDTFVPATDDVDVTVLLRDHDGVWELWHADAPAQARTAAFRAAAEPCEHDIALGADDLDRSHPTVAERWPSMVAIARRLEVSSGFVADSQRGLGFTMDDGLPVKVYAWCDGTAPVDCPRAATAVKKEGSAFFRGGGAPFIALGPVQSAAQSVAGCEADTIGHEWGHAVTADLFGGTIPYPEVRTNHAGYYGNSSSNDSYIEGLASYLGLEARKQAGVGRSPTYTWCASGRSQLDYETNKRAWNANGKYEEWAVAGLLLDLEDGPRDYQAAREASLVDRDVRIAALDDPLGKIIVGRVRNRTGPDVSVRIDLLGAGGKPVGGGEAEIDEEGYFYFAAVPPTPPFTSVRAYGVRGGGRGADDDPIDATPMQVWDALAGFDSIDAHADRPVEVTGVFDVADLYDALRDTFAGDRDRNGIDDVDQVFRDHGFFADPEGDHTFAEGAAIGLTTHPPKGAAAGAVERFTADLPEATRVKVDAGDADANVIVSVAYPPPNVALGYAYVADVGEDGRISVAVPDEETESTTTLLAIAPGRLPQIITTIDAKVFWEEAATHGDEPFLDLAVTMTAGSVDDARQQERDLPALAAGIGAFGSGIALALLGRRSRPLLALAAVFGIAGIGIGVVALTSGQRMSVGTELALAADPDLPDAVDEPVTTSTVAEAPSSTTTATVSSTTAPEVPLDPDAFFATAALADDTTSDGSQVSYGPEQVGDGNRATAWCASGDAAGESLTLGFEGAVEITSVGLVPGYDKVDPGSGRDRWDENRHISSVTYSFDDGTTVTVPLDGSRDIQRHRLDVPVISTAVTIIVESTTGIGDTCVSEVEVTGRV